jgi:hypothetical protein
MRHRRPGNSRVTRLKLKSIVGPDMVRHMKFKSYKTSWATVLCAAAVFSLSTLHNAQALNSLAILPPPPIDGSTTGDGDSLKNPPPPPIDGDVSGGQLNGDFSGTLMLD